MHQQTPSTWKVIKYISFLKHTLFNDLIYFNMLMLFLKNAEHGRQNPLFSSSFPFLAHALQTQPACVWYVAVPGAGCPLVFTGAWNPRMLASFNGPFLWSKQQSARMSWTAGTAPSLTLTCQAQTDLQIPGAVCTRRLWSMGVPDLLFLGPCPSMVFLPFHVCCGAAESNYTHAFCEKAPQYHSPAREGPTEAC